MPRRVRYAMGGYVYHVLNRTLGRATLLEAGPLAKPEHWQEWVNQPEIEADLTALRRSGDRGMPFGAESWQRKTAKRLRLESSLRPVGGTSKSETSRKNNDSPRLRQSCANAYHCL